MARNAGMAPAALGRIMGPAGSELRDALNAFRSAFKALAAISGLINILALTGAFYMLEIYDRVLPSRSVPTLVGLTILAVLLYGFSAALELIRSRTLSRVGAALDQALSSRVFDCVMQLPLKAKISSDGLQPLRDIETIRSFLAGGGPPALFDLPWLPIYLGICFYFHFLIGLTATLGALVLVALTFSSERLTQAPVQNATQFSATRNGLALAGRKNAEVLRAMGMTGRLGILWGEANRRYLAAQQQATDVNAGLGTLSRVLRLFLQSGLLGIGAYLAVNQEMTGGIIIAGSIIGARALAPVDLAIAHWRPFVLARQSWHRLNEVLAAFPKAEPQMPLRRPQNVLQVEDIAVAPPGSDRLIINNVSFALKAGQALGVIGPTASGKSTLARAIVGVWSAARGKVRLDGASLEQWVPESLGRHIGYLPQDVELFDGTVAQNISRFDPEAQAPEIIAAAEAAGVHELILHLPQGYETRVGDSGMALSGGQCQRIALARALYSNPFLIVLDEPNSNLDADGEQALTQAILKARARGGIVIIVAHRPSALAAADQVLVMAQGRMQAFGPKDEVLSKVLVQPNQTPAPRVVVAGGPDGSR